MGDGMNGIKRYGFDVGEDTQYPFSPVAHRYESPVGEYILFDDHEAAVQEAIAAERERCFPNPLQLNVDSKILVSYFADQDGTCGILFQDTGKEHKTGDLYPQALPGLPHTPQQEELYLRFKKAGSAVVVLEALTQTICTLMSFQDRAVEQAVKEHP